jgi:hypothetical protein
MCTGLEDFVMPYAQNASSGFALQGNCSGIRSDEDPIAIVPRLLTGYWWHKRGAGFTLKKGR